MAFFSFSQFKTFWNWIGLAADLFGIVALAITIWQILQVKRKVNSSIDAMNELKRLQEQELLRKIFKELEGQQETLNWLLEKHGQSGYRKITFEEKNAEIISALTRCSNELPIKYKEISKPIRSTVLELRNYNGGDKRHLEEAEGYLYSAIQAVKVADEQFSIDNIKMIAHSD